jgi:DNA topoisomerase-1
MSVAQKLYESGIITYMRTDSVHLSTTALNNARNTIIAEYGPDAASTRLFKTKTKGAQEAHEAIRPTDFSRTTIDADAAMISLYNLIRKRSLASQMPDATLIRTIIHITAKDMEEMLIAEGVTITSEGFLKAYTETEDDTDDQQPARIPPLKTGDVLQPSTIQAVEHFSNPPPRFSEASLVKHLEEQGIGRPSTYAPTISTIQDRGYVVRQDREGYQRPFHTITLTENTLSESTASETSGSEKARLAPTDMGFLVNGYLTEHFERILDYGFTARVEQEFDEIARGKKIWNVMIDTFYRSFHTDVETAMTGSQRVTGERMLGVDPASGKPVSVRMGRYGPMAQIGTREDTEKPRFASLLPDQSLLSITLEQALDLFKLPRTLGEYDGHPVTVSTGRYGPYVRHSNLFVSLQTDQDAPLSITLKRAIELIEERKRAEQNRTLRAFPGHEGVRIVAGRYGPYLAMGEKRVRIPKNCDPETMTIEECIALAAATPEKVSKPDRKKRRA